MRSKLNPVEQAPFWKAAKKLRKILNNDQRFEELVRSGIREIFLIADVRHEPQFRQVLGHEYLNAWCEGYEDFDIPPHKNFFNLFTPPSEREDEVRILLHLLRDTLNDRERCRELIAIGPCELSLWHPGDQPFPDGEPTILVNNFIPECVPNADYSITERGLWYHS